MSWDVGNQKRLNKEPINQQVMDLEGYLEDTQAKIWLYKFLKENVTFTTELLTGIELFPFQHMAVKAMMENDYFLGIWSRGMSKSFSTGIFALLDAMMNQGVHIGIIHAAHCTPQGRASQLTVTPRTPPDDTEHREFGDQVTLSFEI